MTFKAVFEIIEKNIDFYQVIMSDNGMPSFSKSFKDIIRNHISEGIDKIELLKISDKLERDLHIEYMVSGFVGVMSLWINNHLNYSVEEIAKTLFNIQHRNILEIF